MRHCGTLTMDEECTSLEIIEKYKDGNTGVVRQILEKYEKNKNQGRKNKVIAFYNYNVL